MTAGSSRRDRDGGSEWLRRLPHQIPFRAASRVIEQSATRLAGEFVCTANDRMALDAMLIEAMAQFAGGMVLDERGFLSGIDMYEMTVAPQPGDRVHIEVELQAALGGLYRFAAVARVDGVELARGRFTLAAATAVDSEANTPRT